MIPPTFIIIGKIPLIRFHVKPRIRLIGKTPLEALIYLIGKIPLKTLRLICYIDIISGIYLIWKIHFKTPIYLIGKTPSKKTRLITGIGKIPTIQFPHKSIQRILISAGIVYLNIPNKNLTDIYNIRNIIITSLIDREVKHTDNANSEKVYHKRTSHHKVTKITDVYCTARGKTMEGSYNPYGNGQPKTSKTKKNNGFKIAAYNVDGLNCNIVTSTLEHLIKQNDITFIIETHTKTGQTIQINNYTNIHHHRKDGYGGIAVYIKDKWITDTKIWSPSKTFEINGTTEIDDSYNNPIDQIWLLIPAHFVGYTCSKVIIGGLYLPPYKNNARGGWNLIKSHYKGQSPLALVDSQLTKALQSSKNKVILIGDLNIHTTNHMGYNWNNDIYDEQFSGKKSASISRSSK